MSRQSAQVTWSNALTLHERLAMLRKNPIAFADGCYDSSVAHQRLARWRMQPPFADESVFARRLLAEGINEPEFLSLLGISPAILAEMSGGVLAWATAPPEALGERSVEDSALHEEYSSADPLYKGLALIRPLLQVGRAKVRNQLTELCKEYPRRPFDSQVAEAALFQNLPDQLLAMMIRTLTLELHVARLQGRLTGSSAQQRLESFLASLGDPVSGLAIATEYPVLMRQLSACVERWIAASMRFMHDLCADWSTIRQHLLPKEPGLLTVVKDGLGDRHRGGRSVLMAEFSSGRRIIYKPRAMAVDVHYQELLAWMNQRGQDPPFRLLTVIDRGNHGWVEYVQAEGCTREEEVHRFYQRQGGYLALLHVLQATDFHWENIVAVGEHPVLIDMEALFHPRVKRAHDDGAGEFLGNLMNQGVLHIGLLPRRTSFPGTEESLDLSGMGAPTKQTTPFPVPQWEEYGTDHMRLIRKRGTIEVSNNRPTIPGKDVNPADYTDAVLNGFAMTYDLLRRNRVELAASDGLLHRFANDETRAVLRMTRTYGRILYESYHPDVLRDALDRDRLFDSLWCEQAQPSVLDQIVGSEQADLRCGDIPMFTARPGSRTLWTGRGQAIPDFFATSGMTLALDNLQRLGDGDRARQLWLIEASMANLRGGKRRPVPLNVAAPQTALDRMRCIAIARQAGDRLVQLCAQYGDHAGWIRLEPRGGGIYEPGLALLDLYDGMPGIALFLARLSQVTREPRYAELARKSMNTVLAALEANYLSPVGIGAFTGWGGLIYSLTHVGTLWSDPSLIEAALDAVAKLPPLIEQDEAYDIIGGAAGCIIPLLNLHRLKPVDGVLKAAVRCGDHLLAHAVSCGAGVGWLSAMAGDKPLTGFSHGAAGIAWALMALSAATGVERYKRCGMSAVAYERDVFSPEFGNWPDFRVTQRQDVSSPTSPAFQWAWCHGSPGIALARLLSLPYAAEKEMDAEIRIALHTTVSAGSVDNDSLCHGALGNLEPLNMAARTPGFKLWRKDFEATAAKIVDGIDRNGWRCANPLGIDSPGLMTGLAGIGYGLLRIAEPSRVPSVLALAPPAPTRPTRFHDDPL